jgi:hypothetical protein
MHALLRGTNRACGQVKNVRIERKKSPDLDVYNRLVERILTLS